MAIEQRVRGAPVRYGFAVLVSVVALAGSAVIRPWTGEGFFGFVFGSVAASVWFGGAGPGLVATAVCAVGSRLALLPPLWSLTVPSGPAGARWAVSVPVSLLIVVLGRAMWQARARAEREHRQARHAQRVAQRAAARAAMTAEVGASLDGADGLAAAALALTRRLAAELGRVAVVELTEPEAPVVLAVAHREAAAERRVRDRVAELRDPEGGRLLGGPAVPRLVDVGDDGADAVATAVGARSYLVVPLLARGQDLGVLLVARTGDDPPFDADDLTFAQQLAGRAGLALANIRLREREHEIAHALQRSLLPGELPRPWGVSIGTWYLPAQGELMVGGDWYDVLELPDGRLVLMVGDVSGHGVGAAASMGQLRSGLAGLALGSSEPAALLDGAQQFSRHLGSRSLATLALVVLDPGSGVFAYACAGHPPPLVIAPAGEVAVLWEGRSAILGFDAGQVRPQGRSVLEAGQTLLLYTDGLVESRHEDIDAGFRRLAAHAGALATLPVERFCPALTRAMLDGRPNRDDVALLAVRRVGGAGRPAVGGGAP